MLFQQLKSGCPRLSNVTNVAVEVLTSSCFTPSLHRDNQGVRRLMEGLFAHFFSADRQGYHPEDIDWFLELANEQHEWRANLYEADAGVVSGDLFDDILTKYEKSAIRRHPPGESTDVVSRLEVFKRTFEIISSLAFFLSLFACLPSLFFFFFFFFFFFSLSLTLSSPHTQVPHGAISQNVFKLYLARILGTCPKDYSEEATKSGPLELYQHHYRTAIGRVLTSTPGLGRPGPYIPVFYQECPPIKVGPSSDVSSYAITLYIITLL